MRLAPIVLCLVGLEASAHAADRIHPSTVRADAAIRQASKVAGKRARAIGLPAELVRQIDAAGPVLAGRARQAHAGNIKTFGGAELTRTPAGVVMRGTVGSYYGLIADDEVRFGGTDWNGAIGSVRDRLRITVGSTTVEAESSGGSWIAHRARSPLTLATGKVPSGSWLMSTSAGGRTTGMVAFTPDGRSHALTEADWRAAFAD